MARAGRTVVAVGLALMLALPASAALAQGAGDAHADRVAAAQRLLKAQSMESLMMDIAAGMGAAMPEEQRAAFIDMIRNEFDITAVESAVMNSMVRIFTAAEINALADFYGSPEGQSIQKKMGPYMAEVAPLMQQAALEAMQRYLQKHRNMQRAPR